MYTTGHCYLRSPNCAKACAITLLCSNDSLVCSAHDLQCQLLTSSTLRLCKISLFRTAQDWDHVPSVSHRWTVHLEPSIRSCHTLAMFIFAALTKHPDESNLREKGLTWLTDPGDDSPSCESEDGENINQLAGLITPHNQESRAKWMLLCLLACAQLHFSILRHFRTPCLGNAAAHNEMCLSALVNLIWESPGQANLAQTFLTETLVSGDSRLKLKVKTDVTLAYNLLSGYSSTRTKCKQPRRRGHRSLSATTWHLFPVHARLSPASVLP